MNWVIIFQRVKPLKEHAKVCSPASFFLGSYERKKFYLLNCEIHVGPHGGLTSTVWWGIILKFNIVIPLTPTVLFYWMKKKKPTIINYIDVFVLK